MQILVTGATGFVGRAFCAEAVNRGFFVHGTSRTANNKYINGLRLSYALVNEETIWHDALTGCEAVVHLAGRAHILNETHSEPLDEFRAVNVKGTVNLARQAAQQGIKRFVFISSIGVNGSETFDKPFTSTDIPRPHSPYAISKYEAEQSLIDLGMQSGMEIVVIRPPLVYGYNAPGNFRTLTSWLKRGVPLPFGNIHNKRSFIGLDNLTDLIIKCLIHPAAANQTFLVSDSEDVSTSDFLLKICDAAGWTPRLFSFPSSILKSTLKLMGKSHLSQSLFGSLQVDISKTCNLLDWKPPLSIDEGLRQALTRGKQCLD